MAPHIFATMELLFTTGNQTPMMIWIQTKIIGTGAGMPEILSVMERIVLKLSKREKIWQPRSTVPLVGAMEIGNAFAKQGMMCLWMIIAHRMGAEDGH